MIALKKRLQKISFLAVAMAVAFSAMCIPTHAAARDTFTEASVTNIQDLGIVTSNWKALSSTRKGQTFYQETVQKTTTTSGEIKVEYSVLSAKLGHSVSKSVTYTTLASISDECYKNKYTRYYFRERWHAYIIDYHIVEYKWVSDKGKGMKKVKTGKEYDVCKKIKIAQTPTADDYTWIYRSKVKDLKKTMKSK